MAQVKSIDHGNKHRTNIKKGDLVTVKTRGCDHPFMVRSGTLESGTMLVVSLVSGDSYTYPLRDVELFRGTVTFTNDLRRKA